MSEPVREPVRINIRIPAEVNDWLDKESKRTAVPKSSLVYLMIDKYITEKETVSTMQEMPAFIKHLEQAKKLEDKSV